MKDQVIAISEGHVSDADIEDAKRKDAEVSKIYKANCQLVFPVLWLF